MNLRPNMKVLAGTIPPELEVASTTVATVTIAVDVMLGANQSSVRFTSLDCCPIRGQGDQGMRT